MDMRDPYAYIHDEISRLECEIKIARDSARELSAVADATASHLISLKNALQDQIASDSSTA